METVQRNIRESEGLLSPEYQEYPSHVCTRLLRQSGGSQELHQYTSLINRLSDFYLVGGGTSITYYPGQTHSVSCVWACSRLQQITRKTSMLFHEFILVLKMVL